MNPYYYVQNQYACTCPGMVAHYGGRTGWDMCVDQCLANYTQDQNREAFQVCQNRCTRMFGGSIPY